MGIGPRHAPKRIGSNRWNFDSREFDYQRDALGCRSGAVCLIVRVAVLVVNLAHLTLLHRMLVCVTGIPTPWTRFADAFVARVRGGLKASSVHRAFPGRFPGVTRGVGFIDSSDSAVSPPTTITCCARKMSALLTVEPPAEEISGWGVTAVIRAEYTTRRPSIHGSGLSRPAPQADGKRVGDGRAEEADQLHPFRSRT